MSPSRDVETCVKRLLDLLPFYVRSDVRTEVQRMVVPYVRDGRDDNIVTDYIASQINKGLIRHGFYMVVSELRRGRADVPKSYDTTFEA